MKSSILMDCARVQSQAARMNSGTETAFSCPSARLMHSARCPAFADQGFAAHDPMALNENLSAPFFDAAFTAERDVFVAVAETENFTRAVERLHTVQLSLSRQIQDLESEVGVKLLEHNGRHVRQTQAGAIFLKKSRLVLQ